MNSIDSVISIFVWSDLTLVLSGHFFTRQKAGGADTEIAIKVFKTIGPRIGW